MSGWSPPSPPRELLAGIALAYVVVLAYALFIQGSLLLGLVPGIVFLVGYYLWRLLVAVEAIADGVHRIASGREEW